MRVLDFTDWHSNKPTPCLLCLSTWQRRREQLRVLSRDCGNFWSQQVWQRTRGQAFGFTPTGGSCKRKGLMRRLRGRLYWCNSGPRRWVTEFALWNMGVSGGCHFQRLRKIKTAVCISILSMNSPEGWTVHPFFCLVHVRKCMQKHVVRNVFVIAQIRIRLGSDSQISENTTMQVFVTQQHNILFLSPSTRG